MGFWKSLKEGKSTAVAPPEDVSNGPCDIPSFCGDDGERWAAMFIKMFPKCRVDQSTLTCWFVDAIEVSNHVREGRRRKSAELAKRKITQPHAELSPEDAEAAEERLMAFEQAKAILQSHGGTSGERFPWLRNPRALPLNEAAVHLDGLASGLALEIDFTKLGYGHGCMFDDCHATLLAMATDLREAAPKQLEDHTDGQSVEGATLDEREGRDPEDVAEAVQADVAEMKSNPMPEPKPVEQQEAAG